MRTQLRIVAGSLRGRKLTCTVNPALRPTPQMVREALFSILGNAVPLHPYPRDSWGPKEADDLLPDRVPWHDPA